MAKPWEKYAAGTPAQKPWEKYAQAALPEPTPDYSVGPTGYPETGYGEPIDPKSVVRGTAKVLPTAGMIGGGLLASSFGPAGTVAGAGAGALGGEALSQSLLATIGEGPKSYGEAGKGLMRAGLEGSMAEMGGQVGAGMINKYITQQAEALKPISQDVIAAAERLGVPVSKGMLSAEQATQNLESSLSQSKTIAGQKFNEEFINPRIEGMRSKAEEVLSDAAGKDQSIYGRKLKEGIRTQVEGAAELPSAIFEDIKASTSHMSVEPKTIQRISNNISNLEGAHLPGTEANTEANRWVNSLSGVKNVNDLKILRSEANKVASDMTQPAQRKFIAGQVAEKLERAEGSQILRNALRDAATKSEGGKIAEGLMEDTKMARSLWRSIYEDIAPLKAAGVGKNTKTFQQTLAKLDEVPDQDLASKLFSSGDVNNLSKLKEKMPEAFESMRIAKIEDIAEKTKDAATGLVNPVKLIKEFNSMESKVAEMIFGESKANIVRDLETVRHSLPGKIGASDTPRGTEWNYHNLLSPKGWFHELNKYGDYKKLTSPVGGRTSNISPAPISGLLNQGMQTFNQDYQK